jgi:pimeloyl-ACP methyl ester carboxylesterase
MLNLIRHPARDTATAPPLMIVHGLFGSGRNWGAIARALSGPRDVLAVDLRNHGDSPWHPTHSYPAMAADLAEVLRPLGPVDLLGHSMGGKAAMVLALSDPAMVNRLIVADIAPVAYAHDNTRHIETMQRVDPARVGSRAEADAIMAETEPDAALRAFFLSSLDMAERRWKLNLPVLAAEMPRIVGWPEVTGRFDGRTLFLSGADSHYVKAEYRDTIKTLFPQARFARLPGAGHWLHADQPRAFIETVRVFLGP